MVAETERLPIILLAGPTGVGKTALSLKMAGELSTEIVNADSMQVYRAMDIGTAKPTVEERAQAPHHLLDVVDPDEPFDAARYAEMAHPVIRLLHHRGKVPLVVGGTGLYMKVLTSGICEGPSVDPAVRHQLREEERERGLAILHAELWAVDPPLGESLHPNDRQRILRGLEVFRSTGRRLSEWQSEHRFEPRLYPTIKIFLCRSREDLYDRINRRVMEMMRIGFLSEVEELLARGYGPELKPMQSLGYKHMVRHLLGNVPLEAALEQMKRDTRRYAKRQMTWFRGDPEFRWVDAEDRESVIEWVEQRIEAILSHE